MQVLILAGGFGTRLSEETDFIPKPMVKIGDVPIIRHIMNFYARYGHCDFLIALGYKAHVIEDYFDKITQETKALGWNIVLVNTGLETATGGRIKRLDGFLASEFLMTYGDGLSNVNINELVAFHQNSGRIATLTAVRPPARFGVIELLDGRVTKFAEKNQEDAGWINGGFFYLKKTVLEHINGDETVFESEPLNNLVQIGQLGAFEHHGWWQPMDTLRDKRALEAEWQSNKPPWVI
jgi:glucose-1-phosphate cytidylyltransferase